MEARYLEKGDTIIRGGKRFTVMAVAIKRKRIIVQTSGGRLSYKPDEQVIIE